MRKTNFIDILRVIVVFILVLPLFLAWIPMECYSHLLAENLVKGNFFRNLVLSFQELSITLVSTVIFAMILSVLLGYLSVLSLKI